MKAAVTQEKSKGLLCFELQSHLCQVRMPLASWCVNPPLPPTRVEPGPAWVQIPGNQGLQTDIGTDILSDNFPSGYLSTLSLPLSSLVSFVLNLSAMKQKAWGGGKAQTVQVREGQETADCSAGARAPVSSVCVHVYV